MKEDAKPLLFSFSEDLLAVNSHLNVDQLAVNPVSKEIPTVILETECVEFRIYRFLACNGALAPIPVVQPGGQKEISQIVTNLLGIEVPVLKPMSRLLTGVYVQAHQEVSAFRRRDESRLDLHHILLVAENKRRIPAPDGHRREVVTHGFRDFDDKHAVSKIDRRGWKLALVDVGVPGVRFQRQFR